MIRSFSICKSIGNGLRAHFINTSADAVIGEKIKAALSNKVNFFIIGYPLL